MSTVARVCGSASSSSGGRHADDDEEDEDDNHLSPVARFTAIYNKYIYSSTVLKHYFIFLGRSKRLFLLNFISLLCIFKMCKTNGL